MMSDMVRAVFAITPNWNQPETPLIIQWVWLYFHAMEYEPLKSRSGEKEWDEIKTRRKGTKKLQSTS